MADTPKPEDWETATKLIRGGINRSQFGETAEALYLTQGFVYETAERQVSAPSSSARRSSNMRQVGLA